jgi:DNA-binding NarL/FixJ family response regulator
VCTVVIAEDEPLVAERIKVLLEDAGVRVVGVAADAGDAIEIAERHYPTVAILDVRLAGAINGATLADHLDVNYGLEIVFVTGDPLYVWRHTGNRRYQLLAKPFSDDELLKAVTTACAAAHARETTVHQTTSA